MCGNILRHVPSHPGTCRSIKKHVPSHPGTCGNILNHLSSHPSTQRNILRHGSCRPGIETCLKFIYFTPPPSLTDQTDQIIYFESHPGTCGSNLNHVLGYSGICRNILIRSQVILAHVETSWDMSHVILAHVEASWNMSQVILAHVETSWTISQVILAHVGTSCV